MYLTRVTLAVGAQQVSCVWLYRCSSMNSNRAREASTQRLGLWWTTGLPVEIQQAMDALRVIGNESVHPGQIDLDGADSEVVDTLFALLNAIVEDRISKPKQVRQMYALIPPDS